MPATLKVTHKAIGAEVRRGTYDVVLDGERAGSVEMNHTIEIPVEPGRHTLQVRNGRNSSSTQSFGGLRPWPDSSSKQSQAPRSAAVLL
jgi:hypothetical protein